MAFQQDLASLRKLASALKAAIPRVFLHEATVRLMSGASPARTLQLYGRNVRRRRRNNSAGGRRRVVLSLADSTTSTDEMDNKSVSWSDSIASEVLAEQAAGSTLDCTVTSERNSMKRPNDLCIKHLRSN
jgi:hypothetical protein